MKSVTAITATNIKDIRAELNAVLKTYADAKGLVIDLGRFTYTAGQLRGKLTANVASMRPVVAPKTSTGAQTFNFRGLNYVVVAIKGNRPKYPVVATRVGGTQKYKFSMSVLA